METKKFAIVVFILFSVSQKASASMFGEENAVLFKILEQSIRQYTEMRKIVQSGNDTLGLLRDINRGINDSMFLLRTVKPNIDPGLYKDLQNSAEVLRQLERIYGIVSNSPDQKMQKDADVQVAEAIAMNNSIFQYTKQIDQIGEDIKSFSHRVSPGGAQKLTAQSLGVLLHVMNESLRAQATALKMQAMTISIQNKKDKEFTKNTLKLTKDLKSSMENQQPQFSIPRF